MSSELELLPVHMLATWVYCPRLAILEHVQGESGESVDTEEGLRVHRRADHEARLLPPGGFQGLEVARSLILSAPDEGITTTIDVLEAVPDGGKVRPLDFKRGKVPEGPAGVYESDLVQACAQALILRENGYDVDETSLWFDESKRWVTVPVTDELAARTRLAIQDFRATIDRGDLPAPLEDSPKCNSCSLATICLPDEVRLVALGALAPAEGEADRLHRRLVPARDDLIPLHVVTQGARVGIDGEEFVISRKDEELSRVSVLKTLHVGLYGGVHITGPALKAAMDWEIPVGFFSRGGWFSGTASGLGSSNVFMRQAQYRAVDDPNRTLEIVRRLVVAKLRNQRTLLRRNGDDVADALAAIESALFGTEQAGSVDAVRGHEGEGAAAYFGAFARMIRPPGDMDPFLFTQRNRRPPTDPVNAALSFCYAMLTREWTAAASVVGLDPFLGFLHAPRRGRASLALDLMEEFRPIVADSVVVTMINTGELVPGHFIQRGRGCNLTDQGRRTVIQAWERRMDTLVTHPVFGYRLSYRRTFEVQARLLGRYLLGEIPTFPMFLVR